MKVGVTLDRFFSLLPFVLQNMNLLPINIITFSLSLTNKNLMYSHRTGISGEEDTPIGAMPWML